MKWWGNVQLSICRERRLIRGGGMVVGSGEAWGCVARNSSWSLESMSVTLLCMLGRWAAVMLMSKDAVMNHKHLSRCIIMLSLDDPLLMTETRLWLSHWNWISLCESNGAQMAQLMMMGTSSFTIILIGVYLVVQAYWNQQGKKNAPQPYDPEASVLMEQSKLAW